MPNTLEEIAGTVGVTVGELIFGMLREGAIGGAVLAVIAFLLSRFTTEIYGRALLAIFLITAAGAYFGFAVLAGAGPIWTLIELVQVIAFGTMALLGLRDSAWWLAAAWALHPLWDAGLHYLGPGSSFASQPYAIACITFDWVVAAYIAIVYGFGLLGVASRRRDTAPSQPKAPLTQVTLIPFKAADPSPTRPYVLDRGYADFREFLFYALG